MAQGRLRQELQNLSTSESDYRNWGFLISRYFPGDLHYIMGEQMNLLVLRTPKKNVAITIALTLSLQNLLEERKLSHLYLLKDGTATFSLLGESCSALEHFQGTWLEAYLVLAKELDKAFPKNQRKEPFVELLTEC